MRATGAKSHPYIRCALFGFVLPSGVFAFLGLARWRAPYLVGCSLVSPLDGRLAIGFRKIPFACSLPKFRSNGIVTALLFVFGYFAFTSVTAEIETWTLADPFWFFAFVVFVAALWLAFHRWRKLMAIKDSQLIFEEEPATAVEAFKSHWLGVFSVSPARAGWRLFLEKGDNVNSSDARMSFLLNIGAACLLMHAAPISGLHRYPCPAQSQTPL